jgi:hypothetical protein
MPSALGLPGQDDVALAGVVAAWVGAAGAGGAAAGDATCAAATAREFCAGTAGAPSAPGALGTTGVLSVTEVLGAADMFGATGTVGAATGAVGAALGAVGAAFGATLAEGLIGAVEAGAACRSSKVVMTARAAPPAIPWTGAGEAMGTEGLCDRMAPNTAMHMTIARAPIIAASRMARIS